VTRARQPGDDGRRQMDESFVTIMFTDLVGSTVLFDRRGDEAANALRSEHFATLRHAIAEHGGHEVKSTGDGLMVSFSSAVAAVRCAVDIQRATAGATDGLAVRIGLDAGEPLRDGDDLYGTPVNVASRLCDSAGAGEILASDVVRQIAGHRVAELMQPAGTVRLRGIADRVATASVRWDGGAGTEPEPEPAAQRVIRVVIADDQRLLRTGFRVILEAEPDIEVVGEAEDGRSAVDVVLRRRPDVVLMDIRMPGPPSGS
jgi:class 3 adenylate cyclase